MLSLGFEIEEVALKNDRLTLRVFSDVRKYELGDRRFAESDDA